VPSPLPSLALGRGGDNAERHPRQLGRPWEGPRRRGSLDNDPAELIVGDWGFPLIGWVSPARREEGQRTTPAPDLSAAFHV
jgi:hypothetical protein